MQGVASEPVTDDILHVSEGEVRNALLGLNSNKSPGPDGVPN